MVKVKQNISGGLRSLKEAEGFIFPCSYYSIALNNRRCSLLTLRLAFDEKPFLSDLWHHREEQTPKIGEFLAFLHWKERNAKILLIQ